MKSHSKYIYIYKKKRVDDAYNHAWISITTWPIEYELGGVILHDIQCLTISSKD